MDIWKRATDGHFKPASRTRTRGLILCRSSPSERFPPWFHSANSHHPGRLFTPWDWLASRLALSLLARVQKYRIVDRLKPGLDVVGPVLVLKIA